MRVHVHIPVSTGQRSCLEVAWKWDGAAGGRHLQQVQCWIENQGSRDQEGAFGVGPPYLSGHISHSESQHLQDEISTWSPAPLLLRFLSPGETQPRAYLHIFVDYWGAIFVFVFLFQCGVFPLVVLV